MTPEEYVQRLSNAHRAIAVASSLDDPAPGELFAALVIAKAAADEAGELTPRRVLQEILESNVLPTDHEWRDGELEQTRRVIELFRRTYRASRIVLEPVVGGQG